MEVDLTMSARTGGIPEHISTSLRNTYPQIYSDLEKAILDSAETIDLSILVDIEVHAGRLRLIGAQGRAISEVPFDLTGFARSGVEVDFVLSLDRQTVFVLGVADADAAKMQLFHVLRPYYWLVEGGREPGKELLVSRMPAIRDLLADVLVRDDAQAVHPWIRAVLHTTAESREAGTSELVQSVQRVSAELRRTGIAPDLCRVLDDAVGLRRGVLPVLATRRVSRRAVLRGIGADDVDSMRRALDNPAVAHLVSAHANGAQAVAEMDAGGLLDLADDLRECEFVAIFLARTAGHVVPGGTREAMRLAHSLSRANSYLFSREDSRRTGRTVHDCLPGHGRGRRIVGFFPGLGSRAFYQDLGRELLDSGSPEVAEIYRVGARTLGFPGQPERLLMTPDNLPAGHLAAQGFVGAAFLVHSLALDAHLRWVAAGSGVAVRFIAYTGESLGIITAAAAAGAISVADGVRLAHMFTPLMLTVAECPADDQCAERVAAYLPEALRGRRLVTEPHHVIGLRGEPADLGEILAEAASAFLKSDVEVHKFYSRRQANVYVREGAKRGFDAFTANFPNIEVEELKASTTFLAHSERMRGARRGFERFMADKGIAFRMPHTPVVSNNDTGLLTTSTEIRAGILAITDEVMASRATVETVESLRPDAVLELGLGGKSVQLLLDNDVRTPVTSYTGSAEVADVLPRALRLLDVVLAELEALNTGGGRLAERHYHLLREIFRLSERNEFCEQYLHRSIGRVASNEALRDDPGDPSALHHFLEIYQHTSNYRRHVELGDGELVLRARVKKSARAGEDDELGRVYTELTLRDASGIVTDRCVTLGGQHEAVVFHFDQLPGLDYGDLAGATRLMLDAQPSVREIYERVFESLGIEDDRFLTSSDFTGPTVEQLALSYLLYPYSLFQLLRLHRPAIFLHGYHVAGGDPMGWLVALAVSGAARLPDLVHLYSAFLRSGAEADETQAALERVLTRLGTPGVPVISPEGAPLQAKPDLEATTRAVFPRDHSRRTDTPDPAQWQLPNPLSGLSA